MPLKDMHLESVQRDILVPLVFFQKVILSPKPKLFVTEINQRSTSQVNINTNIVHLITTENHNNNHYSQESLSNEFHRKISPKIIECRV